jgi:hypothetical protein
MDWMKNGMRAYQVAGKDKPANTIEKNLLKSGQSVGFAILPKQGCTVLPGRDQETIIMMVGKCQKKTKKKFHNFLLVIVAFDLYGA